MQSVDLQFAHRRRMLHHADAGLSQCHSGVLKFADDTKLYRPVNNQMNGMSLQQDLNIVSNWAERWQMEFNVSKCKVMHYGKKNIGYTAIAWMGSY